MHDSTSFPYEESKLVDKMKGSLFHIASFSLLLFLSLPSSSLSKLCNPNDEKALLQIKQALNNPRYFSSWNPDTDCCADWSAVGCDSTTNRVVSLSVDHGDLSGQIPAAVGDLPYLQSIDFLKLPNLTGGIPPAIVKLTHFRFLRISWTNLSGPIPSFLGQLKNLDYLDLSFNNLTGSIPPSLAQLTKLETLGLDRNKLTGPIPEFGKFTPKLGYLVLSHNQLSGPIPKPLGNLNFSTFDVSRNYLSGDISFLYGPNKSIVVGDFSRNMFEFDLTNIVINENLPWLDLNHNKVYGSIPEAFTKLNWQNLNVSYNRLCGQIPVGGRLQSFGPTAYFHNRCLCGAPLPACK